MEPQTGFVGQTQGRITQGTRSEKGRETNERLWTVVGTCALQGRSACSFYRPSTPIFRTIPHHRCCRASLDELRDYARKESLPVVREYIEAQTAKEPGRPVFNEMMEAIEAGEVGSLLAWHPDRISRNAVDVGRLLPELDKQKLQALSFPSFWLQQDRAQQVAGAYNQ